MQSNVTKLTFSRHEYASVIVSVEFVWSLFMQLYAQPLYGSIFTKLIYSLVILSLFSLLTGCAGRAPAPVSVVQAQDRYLDCKAILAEVESNNKKVSELASEEGLKVAQNVAAGVVGIVIPVLWFGMDWQGAASKEVTALQSRQQYLATMAEERCHKPEENAETETKTKKKSRRN